MTYNFDPDEWLRRERVLLDLRRARGEIIGAAYRDACLELDRRYDEMVERLDGTYQIRSGETDD